MKGRCETMGPHLQSPVDGTSSPGAAEAAKLAAMEDLRGDGPLLPGLLLGRSMPVPTLLLLMPPVSDRPLTLSATETLPETETCEARSGLGPREEGVPCGGPEGGRGGVLACSSCADGADAVMRREGEGARAGGGWGGRGASALCTSRAGLLDLEPRLSPEAASKAPGLPLGGRPRGPPEAEAKGLPVLLSATPLCPPVRAGEGPRLRGTGGRGGAPPGRMGGREAMDAETLSSPPCTLPSAPGLPCCCCTGSGLSWAAASAPEAAAREAARASCDMLLLTSLPVQGLPPALCLPGVPYPAEDPLTALSGPPGVPPGVPPLVRMELARMGEAWAEPAREAARDPGREPAREEGCRGEPAAEEPLAVRGW